MLSENSGFQPTPSTSYLRSNCAQSYEWVESEDPPQMRRKMIAKKQFRFDLHGPSVDNHTLLSLCHSNPKELRLSYCASITDEGLSPLFQLGEIVSLSLNKCPNLTDLTLELISSHLRKLKVLELSDQSNFSDHTLSLLLASCPNLTSLSINNCDSFTDSALFSISLFGKAIHSLRLSSNPNISEKGFGQLSRKLETLNLSSNPVVTDELCQNILSSSPNLIYFDASFCPKLSMPLSDANIQILNLQGCSLIGDSFLEALSQKCPSLTHLYLAYSSVTDKGLEKLVSKKLKTLDLSRSRMITDYGVKKILESCPSLTHFNLLDCPLLTLS